MKGTTIIRLLFGIILVSILIYIYNPVLIISTMISANPYYLAQSTLLYPIMMLIYTYRWIFILSMMGNRLSLLTAFQVTTAGALLSDFTPGRLGDFLKVFAVKNRIDVGRGVASTIIDHYADALTSILLGAIGLLVLPHEWNLYLFIAVLVLLSGLFLISLFWVMRHTIMNLIERTKRTREINAARSIYDAIEAVDDAPKLMLIAILIGLAVWLPYAVRIFLIIRALGYTAPIYVIFFLLPLVSMLTALPVTVSGLGLVEGGMVALMVVLGIPPSVGIPVALIDRGISVASNALFGWHYALKLFRMDVYFSADK